MRSRRRAILIFWACIIAAGCEAAGPGLQPISDPTRRVEVPGLSVLPPPGDNWFLFPVSPHERIPGSALIMFAKKLRDAPAARPEDERLVYAGVFGLDLGERRFDTPPEFLEHFKGEFEGRTGEMITGRQRLIGFEATLDDSLGATCVRYSRLTEVTGLARFPDALFILATRGFTCLHPHWPRYAVNVVYSQLYPKGQEPLALDAEAETFLKTPVFTSTRPVASALPSDPARESPMISMRKAVLLFLLSTILVSWLVYWLMYSGPERRRKAFVTKTAMRQGLRPVREFPWDSRGVHALLQPVELAKPELAFSFSVAGRDAFFIEWSAGSNVRAYVILGAGAPYLRVMPKELFAKPADSIDFPDDLAFSQAFHVLGTDERATRRCLTPELRRLLLAYCKGPDRASGWIAKISDPWAAWAVSSPTSLWSFHGGPEGVALVSPGWASKADAPQMAVVFEQLATMDAAIGRR